MGRFAEGKKPLSEAVARAGAGTRAPDARIAGSHRMPAAHGRAAACRPRPGGRQKPGNGARRSGRAASARADGAGSGGENARAVCPGGEKLWSGAVARDQRSDLHWRLLLLRDGTRFVPPKNCIEIQFSAQTYGEQTESRFLSYRVPSL